MFIVAKESVPGSFAAPFCPQMQILKGCVPFFVALTLSYRKACEMQTELCTGP